MKAQKILLPIIAVLGALVFFSIFIVKEVNQAIVLQFGDPKKIIIDRAKVRNKFLALNFPIV